MTALTNSAAAEEAAAWHTRLQTRSISLKDVRAFQAWRQDPAHAAAFAKIDATWGKLDQLADDPEIQALTRKAMAEPPPRPRVSWSAIPRPGVALGLAALLGAVGVGAMLYARSETTWSTRTGEQRLVVLEDGSRIRLNTDSRVRVHFGRDRRDVTLVRGEAFFEPAHNAQRPFTVTAGPAAVRATGTRFDVRRDDQAVRVTLVEGRVDVRPINGPPTALLPDQQLTVTAHTISAPRPADTAGATSWTSGHLIFRATPLGDAVAEVNRYARRKIVLDGPDELAQRPVTGAFNTGDTASFVQAVDTLFALQARADPDGTTHLGARAPSAGR